MDNPVTGHGAWIQDAIGKLLEETDDPTEKLDIANSLFDGFTAFVISNGMKTWKSSAVHAQVVLSESTENFNLERIYEPIPDNFCIASSYWSWDLIKKYGMVVIQNCVYDFTAWIPRHPGDIRFNAIQSWRGQDASIAFKTIHPGKQNLLAEFLCGLLLHEKKEHGQSKGVALTMTDEVNNEDTYYEQSIFISAYHDLEKQVQSALDVHYLHNLTMYHHPNLHMADVFKHLSPLATAKDLLQHLATSRYVDCTNPSKSTIYTIVQIGQPMYGVLSATAVQNWIAFVCENLKT